jgi:hypothetical protein
MHHGNAQPVFLAPEAEIQRLDRHFRRVLGVLHREPPPRLGRAARGARTRRLEALERYRRGRAFPKNRSFPGLMLPIFVDHEGTHCAMGQLIAEAGGRDLVEHVRATMNYARIREMADIPELVDWLERNGLTAEEAAMIQPTYCDVAASCICSTLAATILEATVLVPDTSVMVTGIHGAAQGVTVGDTVTLTAKGPGIMGDQVLVNYHPPTSPGAAVVEWVVPSSGDLAIPTCNFYGKAPGPLPATVWAEAVVADSGGACYDVLEAEHPLWIKGQGDGCGGGSGNTTGGWTTTTGSGGGGGQGGEGGSGGKDGGGGSGSETRDAGGCAVPMGPTPGGSVALALLAGLCVAHGLRRSRRSM